MFCNLEENTQRGHHEHLASEVMSALFSSISYWAFDGNYLLQAKSEK